MSRAIRILYIDDNLLDRELVRDGLTREHSGFELTEAASRSDFETALVKGGFDLVLSDFNILGFEGLQVLEAVHAKDARMPVIIVTGTGSEEVAVEALKRGAADYVIKTPKHIQHLPHTIHAVLEKKRLEQEQRDSEERYRLIFENSGEAILLTNSDGTIYSANPEACRIFQWNEEELRKLGRQGVVDTNDSRLLKALEERGVSGKFKGELNFIRKDGTVFPADVSTTLFMDMLGKERTSMVIRDITESKQAEAALTRSEQAHRTLFENMPIGLYRTSAVGLILDANPALVKMFGYKDRESILAKNIAEFYVDPAYDEKFKNEFKKSNNLSNFVAEYRRLDGTTFWTEDHVHIVRNEAGVVLFYEGSLIDITERRQAEKKIRRQIDYLTALEDIDRTIASAFDMHPSLNALISKAVSLLAVDAAAVLLMNFGINALEFAAGAGFRTNAVKTSNVKLGESYAGRAAMNKVIVKIPNLKDESDNLFLTSFFEAEDFVSYYGVPLIVKDNVIGVLEVFQRSLIKRDQEWLDFLNALAGQAAIAISKAQLFDNLQHSNNELIRSYDATIEGWSRAMDLRDKETEGHTLRVTEITTQLARLMQISDADQVQIHRGALLHDIGKLGVPDAILLKPGKLTDEEWVIMRQHPTHAYEMLSSVEYLKPALDIPYCHHEKWDGSGYPRGLKGEQIPLTARIFAIVDVWDALRSDRPYRSGWPDEKVLDYIRAETGKHFDPEIAKVFLNLITEK